MWRIQVVRGLYDRRVSLVVGTAGVAVVAALFVVLTKTMVQPLLAIPALHSTSLCSCTERLPVFLSFIWFGFAQLLIDGVSDHPGCAWSAETQMAASTDPQQPGVSHAVVIERAWYWGLEPS